MTEPYKSPFYASLEIDRMINEGGHVDPAQDTESFVCEEKEENDLK